MDNTSLSAIKWFPIDRNLSYNDVVRRIYDALYELNVECDIIHADRLDPARYKVIITPALYCVREELIQKLKDFVKSGGTLISTFKSFFADRDVTVWQDRQPHGLVDCFGMSYQMFVSPENLFVGGKECRYFAELLMPEKAETILPYQHRYRGKYAAVTSNRCGEGEALYIGSCLDQEVLKQVLMQIPALKAARAAGDCNWPVVIRSGMNEAGKLLHYVLHFSEEEEEWICPFEAVTDLLTGKEYKKGERLCLTDWTVLALEEQM